MFYHRNLSKCSSPEIRLRNYFTSRQYIWRSLNHELLILGKSEDLSLKATGNHPIGWFPVAFPILCLDHRDSSSAFKNSWKARGCPSTLPAHPLSRRPLALGKVKLFILGRQSLVSDNRVHHATSLSYISWRRDWQSHKRGHMRCIHLSYTPQNFLRPFFGHRPNMTGKLLDFWFDPLGGC